MLFSVELSEWVSAQERNLNASGLTEHSLLIDLPESATPSKVSTHAKETLTLMHILSRIGLLIPVHPTLWSYNDEHFPTTGQQYANPHPFSSSYNAAT